jgi:hypothetical protein
LQKKSAEIGGRKARRRRWAKMSEFHTSHNVHPASSVLVRWRTHALAYVFALLPCDALVLVLGLGIIAHHSCVFSAPVGTVLVLASGIARDDFGRRLLRKGHGRHEDDSREHEAGCKTLHGKLLGGRH